MITTEIRDPVTGQIARVTNFGELVVGNLDFSDPIQKDMTVVDVANNFFKPVAGKLLIITDVIVNARRTVNVNGSIVEIYEANDTTDTAIGKQTLKFDLGRQQVIALTGLNFRITEGKFLNAKCDSATVLVTIAGYFAPSEENLAVTN